MHQSVDYAFPFDLQSQVTKPAVWCLVISNGAFWPVECYPWTDSNEATDGYNDAVDKLIQDDYVSLLHRKNSKWSDSKLRKTAQDLWKDESERYGFDYSFDDKRRGTNYLLAGELPPSAKREPRRAHLAELALGLDGFLGFVSLILSAFSLMNCAQYFVSCTWCCDGVFVRWSLFYVPLSRGDRRIISQASRFRFHFFVMLLLVQVAVLSPLLARTCFPIDWDDGLHPRHRIVMVMGLLALLLLAIVVFVALVKMIGASRGPTFLPWGRWRRGCRPLRSPRRKRFWVRCVRCARWLPWRASLAISLVAPAVCLLAWLPGICFPWDDGWRGIAVVSATLLGVLLVAWPLSLLPLKRFWAWLDTSEPSTAQAGGGANPADVGGNQPDPANNGNWLRRFFFNAFRIVIIAGVVVIVASLGFLLLVLIGTWDYWITVRDLRYYYDPSSADLTRLAMFTERAGNLASGVSPIFPALCVFAGLSLVAICHLRRVRWLCWRPIASPIPNSTLLELTGIHKQIGELSKTLRYPPVVWFGWLPLLLVTSVGSLVVFAWPRETFETQLFKWFVRAGLLALLGVITVTWFQTLAVWDCLRQLLHRLAWHPMATAYVHLPGMLKRKFRAQLFAAVPTDIEFELPLQQWQYLRHEAEALKEKPHGEWLGSLIETIEQLNSCADSDRNAHEALDYLLVAEAELVAQRRDARRNKDHELKQRGVITTWARERSQLLAGVLDKWWEARRERNPEPREKKRDRPSKDPAEREDRLCEKAEEFVAIQLALVVRCALAHLKNYLGTSVAVVLLLLGMLNSYPFQPHRMLLIVGWAISLFIVGTALWIFAACNRDEALSRLSGLHPNKIDWDRQFILAVFSYGVVPVLVLLSMQFPEFGSYVYSPLEFVSKVLK